MKFLKDERGAVGAEYAVLLVIIAGAMILAAGFLGEAIGDALNRTANCLNAGAACGAP